MSNDNQNPFDGGIGDTLELGDVLSDHEIKMEELLEQATPPAMREARRLARQGERGIGLEESTIPSAQEAFEMFCHNYDDMAKRDVQHIVKGLLEKNEQVHETAALERRIAAAIMRYCPIGVSIFDRNGRMIAANRAFTELTGHAPDGSVALEHHPKVYGQCRRLNGTTYRPEDTPLGRALREGEYVRSEFMVMQLKPEGQGSVLNVTAAPITNKRGEVISAVRFTQLAVQGRYPDH